MSLTQVLLLVNIAFFLLEPLTDDSIAGWLALWPLDSGLFMPWQVVTYAFLHGSLMHLGFNMLGLWMFGAELERVWGSRRFAWFYLASVLAAATTELIVMAISGSEVPTIGASGGVFGLLMGFALLFPRRTIMLIFPPIPMPAWLFVTLYAGFELTLGLTGRDTGVAHFAHLGGLLGGWLMIRYWRGQLPFGPTRRP